MSLLLLFNQKREIPAGVMPITSPRRMVARPSREDETIVLLMASHVLLSKIVKLSVEEKNNEQ